MFLALADDANVAAIDGQIGRAQPADLGYPEPGRIHGGDERPIARADERVLGNCRQQPIEIANPENHGERPRDLRGIDDPAGIAVSVALGVEKLIEAANCGESTRTRSRANAGIREVKEIVGDVANPEIARAAGATIARKREQSHKVPAISLDGVRRKSPLHPDVCDEQIQRAIEIQTQAFHVPRAYPTPNKLTTFPSQGRDLCQPRGCPWFAMHIPALADFKRAAERGNLLPVYREILADSLTPVSAYAALGKGDYSFLLESVVGGEKWAAYSFIGVAPRAVIRVASGEAKVVWYDVDGTGAAHEASWKTNDPTAALAEVMAAHEPVAPPGLPRFWGGAVGWLSYDAVRSFENLPARAQDDLGVPEMTMVLTDTLIIFDNLRQTIKVVATPFVPRPERAEAAYAGAIERIDSIVDKLRGGAQRLRPMLPPTAGDSETVAGAGIPAWKSSFPEEEFKRATRTIKEYILAGDVFQAVLSQRLEVPREGIDTFDAYRALRVLNPSPYMFHLKSPEVDVTGASPETLVRLSDGIVDLRPIAGTRPRGASDDADAALEAELIADPKERAEHLMLLDLGRNDVGRVARTGSVTVPERMIIERYSHVMHMVSSVRGKLADGLGWADVLRAAFPAGTLSGAPKIRAMEIIDELEPHRRGIYGGGAGYISYTGNIDFAIAIRTMIACGESIFVQAGAGIVHDSDPDREYQETLNKAHAVLRAVGAAKT